MTDAALIVTSTRNTAASSRICHIARRRVASSVTSVGPKEIRQSPRGIVPGNAPNVCRDKWFLRLSDSSAQAARSRSGGRLAGQILFEPVDVIVAVDDGGFPNQGPEQR